MAWIAVMKSGTIVTAYYSYIARYVILIGAMDCVSMYECMLCMYKMYKKFEFEKGSRDHNKK